MFLKIAQGMPSFKMFFFSNFTGVWYPKFQKSFSVGEKRKSYKTDILTLDVTICHN